MVSFDLVDRPWIPCVGRDGTMRELGLRDALLAAHELRELFDPSPLVTVALHRLLLAVLHRAYHGPATLAAWRDIWQAGQFEPERVGAYLDQWRHRFDLFDTARPFYQVPFIAELGDSNKQSPVARLATELATGSNPTLFDHHVEAVPLPISFPQAARVLVAAQNFALAGGNSKPFNFSHGTMVAGYTVLAVGESLFETLALNLQPYNRNQPFEWLEEDDPPCWEQEIAATPQKSGTPILGYVDYLTLQCRRIRLIPDDGSETVTHCQVIQNLTVNESTHDPFKCYRKSKQKGWWAQKFVPERALWRDSTVLFQQLETEDADNSTRRPGMMHWLAQIEASRRHGTVQARNTYRLQAFGLTTAERKAGSVVLWRREELPLPLALLDEPRAVDAMRQAIDLAERVHGVLDQSTDKLTRLLLSPLADGKSGRKLDPNSVQHLADSLGIERRFWPGLAAPFAVFLTQLPTDRRVHPDDAEEIEYGAATVPRWRTAVAVAARQAFIEGTAGLDRSARALKAVAVARRQFARALAQVMGDDQEKGVAA